MKILCIGDSLGMPREGCPEEDVWISLLKKKFPGSTFIGEFKRARLVKNALACYRQKYRKYNADIVILQLGIVDCSPRYVNTQSYIVRIIYYLFNKLGKSDLYWRIVKSRPRRPSCVYTSPSKFRNEYTSLIKEIINDGGNVIVIKIGHGGESVLRSSMFFNSNVDRYNKILENIVVQNIGQVCSVNPLDNVGDDDFVDGYHCNEKGMRKVYEALCQVLTTMLKDPHLPRVHSISHVK